MDEKEIGKRIKEVRIKKNMTQKELAEASKIDATSISRYETGVQMPNLSTLAFIASSLETSLDYLVFGNGNEFKVYKKNSQSAEERIFEGIATLIEEYVFECYDEYDGGTHIILSDNYNSYKQFIEQYKNLKNFKGLIGKNFEDARAELIKSYAQQLKNEIQASINELPF